MTVVVAEVAISHAPNFASGQECVQPGNICQLRIILCLL